MKKLIIISVDRGHFKAYRVTQNPMESAKTELIKSYDSVAGHGKLTDKLSDNAGRFAMGGGKNGSAKGYGEPHNMLLENEKKLIKMLTKDITEVICREKCSQWYLAAVKGINNEIVRGLDQSVKGKLRKNITADLTKVTKSEILGYFE